MSAIDELERLDDDASPGPWRCGTKVRRTLYRAESMGVGLLGLLDRHEDTALIVAMRNTLPALLKVARAAEAYWAAEHEALRVDPVDDYWARRQLAWASLDAALAELREVGASEGEMAAIAQAEAMVGEVERARAEARAYEAKYRQTLARVESAVSLAGDLGAELQRARRAARAWKALAKSYRKPFHSLRPCDWCKRPSSRLTRCGKLEKPTEPVPGGNGFMDWNEDLCPECMKIRDAKFAAGEAWWLKTKA